MSLKFLFKKGFHPARLDIQEKIWKAEQAKDAEDKRITELRQKIDEEKGLDELRKLQEIAGGRATGNGLDWMYAGPQAQKQVDNEVESEAYMTGKSAIGSTAASKASAPGDFDLMSSSARLNAITGARAAVTRPPDAPAPMSRNEAFSIHNEDPLVAIHAQEAAGAARARDALLSDPAIAARLRAKLAAQLGDATGQRTHSKGTHRIGDERHERHEIDVRGTEQQSMKRSSRAVNVQPNDEDAPRRERRRSRSRSGSRSESGSRKHRGHKHRKHRGHRHHHRRTSRSRSQSPSRNRHIRRSSRSRSRGRRDRERELSYHGSRTRSTSRSPKHTRDVRLENTRDQAKSHQDSSRAVHSDVRMDRQPDMQYANSANHRRDHGQVAAPGHGKTEDNVLEEGYRRRERDSAQAPVFGLSLRGAAADQPAPDRSSSRQLGPSDDLIAARQRALAAVGKLRSLGKPSAADRGAYMYEPGSSEHATEAEREARLAAMKDAARARVAEMQGRLACHRAETSGPEPEQPRGNAPAFISTTASAALQRAAEARS